MTKIDTRSVEEALAITPVNAKKKIINTLKSENIYYLEDLLKMSRHDLCGIPNLGELSIERIEQALRSQNKSLRLHIAIAQSTGTRDRRFR